MDIQYFGLDLDLRSQFPDARIFRGWEGGCAYRAERDGKYFIIKDERTFADLLDDEDHDLLDRLVQALKFDTESEREAYIEDHMKYGVDMSGERWQRF